MRAIRKAVLGMLAMLAFVAAEPVVPVASGSVVAAQPALWDYHRVLIFDWCSGACEGGLCCQLVVV